jgi:Zn-finger protein
MMTKTYTIQVTDADLGDMLTGRSIRNCQDCIKVVNTSGADVWINADPRIAQMSDEHKKWFKRVLPDELVQEMGKNLAMTTRAVGGVVEGPWEPSE